MRKILFMLLTIMLVLACADCSQQLASKSSEAIDKVQPGEWMAEFSINLASGKTENWEVYFDVSEDGKTVPTVQLIHYIGDQTPQSVLLLRKDPSIKNNSFDFSLTEMDSYTMYTYKGNATFTSSQEADGTLNVYDVDYQFTAVPVSE